VVIRSARLFVIAGAQKWLRPIKARAPPLQQTPRACRSSTLPVTRNRASLPAAVTYSRGSHHLLAAIWRSIRRAIDER
jgi:hypothetical protein